MLGGLILTWLLVLGGSLERHLKQRGSFSPEDTLFYVGAVALALETIHSKRVVTHPATVSVQ